MILRWHVQRGTVPLVKTSKEERLGENIALYDWELSEEEMKKMDDLERGIRLFNPRYINGYDWNGMPFFE